MKPGGVQKMAPVTAASATAPTQQRGVQFEMSDKTKASLDVLAQQMSEAERGVAASEVQHAPDAETLDPLFNDMLNKPSLAVASIAARKRAEAGLAQIEIDDLFVSGEIRQRVAILGDKLVVTFRTLNAGEDLYIKRRLTEVRNETARYAEDRFLMMQLAAHIAQINDDRFPSIMSASGEIDDKQFDQRFQRVGKLPVVLIERLWVNWMWFQDRVNKAMSPDFLGRG